MCVLQVCHRVVVSVRDMFNVEGVTDLSAFDKKKSTITAGWILQSSQSVNYLESLSSGVKSASALLSNPNIQGLTVCWKSKGCKL